MDAYVFATGATPQAVSDVLALVSAGTARAALPTTDDRKLYVAVADTSATNLVTKLAAVLTVDGLTAPVSHLAYGSPTTERPFPTQGIVEDYIGFALLTTLPGNTVAVYEAAFGVSGVVGAAMVTGTVNVLVEATAATSAGVATILSAVRNLTGVTVSAAATGQTSAGAGFST